MKKLVLFNVLILLMILMQPIKVKPSYYTADSKIMVKSLTPSINTVKFIYYTGDSSVVNDANLSTFLNDILDPFSVEEISSLNTYSDLENASVLMLLGLTSMDSIDMTLLVRFLRDGGSLLLAFPEEDYSVYNRILDLFSLKTSYPILDNSSYENVKEIVIINSTYMTSNHPIFNSVFGSVEKIIIPHGIGIEPTGDKANINATFTQYSLVWGTSTTFIDKNDNKNLDEDEKKGVNVSVIHILELWYGGKIVILPSVYMMTDEYLSMTKFNNYVFLKALTYWLGDQIGYISIRDITVSTTNINLHTGPFELNVSFRITDENNNSLSDLKVDVYLTRLSQIIKNATQITKINDIDFRAVLNAYGLKAGVAIVYVMAYKPHYGYHWAGGIEIILFKPPVIPAEPDILMILFGIVIPAVIGFSLVIYLLPEYRSNRQKIREIEEKVPK